MYLCYIDESGTPDIPGNTSHFILAGMSIPIWHWRDADRETAIILSRYGLTGAELHTAWIARAYQEQARIAGFEQMAWPARRAAVESARTQQLLQLQRKQNSKAYRQLKKNYAQTKAYIHLTRSERSALLSEVATMIGSWGFARLFAECIDKVHFDPVKAKRAIDEQAFEQVVSRFEQYLQKTEQNSTQRSNYGLLVHDNNETVCRKFTQLMRNFHSTGTLWTSISNIIETPLFVDSQLTGMVQLADLCAYSLRRYVENGEFELLKKIMLRADRHREISVGVRHFTKLSCTCEICVSHRPR